MERGWGWAGDRVRVGVEGRVRVGVEGRVRVEVRVQVKVNHQVLLAQQTTKVLVDDVLHVGLEHFERERGRPRRGEAREEDLLQLVCHGVMVVLTQHHDIGFVRSGEQLREGGALAIAAPHAEVSRAVEVFECVRRAV